MSKTMPIIGTLALHPRDVTISTLRKAVDQISSQASYRERARSLQKDIQRAGGYQAAVDAITTYTQGPKQPGQVSQDESSYSVVALLFLGV